MAKAELCEILVKWLDTFQVSEGVVKPKDLSDGVLTAQVLHEIDPEWFTESWLSKIKKDTGDNWRLKVSNLKKVLEKVLDYYADAFSQTLPERIRPDVVKIGDGGDTYELARLLQLILGCAVNCDNKQEYIKRIMCMEENDQRVMMECIQELEAVGGGSLNFVASLIPSLDPHIEALQSQLTSANSAKERAELRVHELELQVTMLQEEKALLADDKKKLQDEVQSRFEPGVGGPMRRQLESIKEELYKVETARDDYRLKMEHQERELVELRGKVDELTRVAGEARSLKDELDALRETADKADKYEATLQSYKKKLEEASDVKRELKLVEAKMQEYIQANIELEDEVKKAGALKAQVEIYKKQVSELHDRISEETKRADRLQYENKTTQDKLAAALREKERLLIERDSLREANEEMKCAALQDSGTTVEALDLEVPEGSMGLASMSELRQKIARLEHENNMLRLAQKEREEDSLSVVQNLLDDARAQVDKMWKENREANQRVIQLEVELKEKLEDFERERARLLSDLDEKEAALSEAKESAASLTEKLSTRELDLQESEEKFKRYVEKARSVVKAIEPNTNLSSADGSLLRVQLAESQRDVKEKEKELEEMRRRIDAEQKMMATAWHELGSKKQKEGVQKRLASLGHGQSFLAIQRQPVARRLNTFNSSH